MNQHRVNCCIIMPKPSYPLTLPPPDLGAGWLTTLYQGAMTGFYAVYRPAKPPSPGIPIKPVLTGLSIISQRTRVCVITDNLVYSFLLTLLRRCGSHRGSVFSSTLAIQPLANGWSPVAAQNKKGRLKLYLGANPPISQEARYRLKRPKLPLLCTATASLYTIFG